MTQNEKMTKAKNPAFKILSILVVIVMISYFVISAVINERLSDLQIQIKALISEQKVLLVTVSEITGRNGADEVTERIVKDCSGSERNSFDDLLSGLNRGLTQAQLVELERLFGRCGSFFSDKKSVMASRMQREVELYETYVNLLSDVSSEDLEQEYSVAGWNNLAELEVKQSLLFAELVNAQDKIINLLLADNNAQSAEVTEAAQEANEIRETLIVTEAQSSEVRSSLVSL